MKWITEDDARFYGHWANRNGLESVEYYNQQVTNRRQKYSFEKNEKYLPFIEQLNDKGHCKAEGFFDKNLLLELKEETEKLIKENKHIKRRDENNIVIDQPFLYTKTEHKIAFHDSLIQIASMYFNCLPAIGTFNLRKSMASQTPAEGTNLFHRDFNSTVKILKFFFYMNDVNMSNGPFTYVEDSNRKMFEGWWYQHRWRDDQLAMIYGKDKIKHLTANFGDMLMARTNGWHKGQKLISGERLMLTVNFVIHPELAGGRVQSEEKRFQINKQDYENLPEHKKPVADFLIKV